MKPTLRSLAVAALATALVVGCTASSGGLGPVPSPATPSPSASNPPDLTPAPTPPATQDPGGSPAPTPTPGPSTAPGQTTIVRAYFHLEGDLCPPCIVPVLREVPETVAVGRAAMEQLLAGPGEGELNASPAISSAIPQGSRLLGLSIAGGIATVDLSAEFESGGGSTSVVSRLAQVVFTLTQFPTVRAVAFEIEGRPVGVFSSEGYVLDGPIGREEFEDQLPAIFVDRPAWGAALGNPGRVSGSANVFEATLMITLLDGAGRTVVEDFVTATCGTGCRGTFEATLDYDVESAQWGTLRVWEASAQDGRPINVRDYPVYLTPR